MPGSDRHDGDPTVTDVRLPEKWLNDRRLVRLSDPGYRLFVAAMLWSVSNRTDGAVDTADLPTIPHVDTSRAAELVSAGLWRTTSEGWVITDYAATQTGRRELERLETIRRGDRERKARERAAAKSAGNPEDASTGTAQDRTGKDRLGQEDLPAPEKTNENQQSPPSPSPGGVGWDDRPCDWCLTVPSRVTSSGSRACASC